MNKACVIGLCVGVILGSVMFVVPPSNSADIEVVSVADVSYLQQCVVVITGIQVDGTKFSACGVLIDDHGTVATAKHVVEGAAIVYVHYDDSLYNAYAWVSHADSDCAIIRTNIESPVYAERGLNDDLCDGEEITLVSNLGGIFEDFISRGVVADSDFVAEGIGEVVIMDATAFSGSSGGGVFDEDGKLVAIIVAYWQPCRAVSMAVPIKFINELAEIIKGV